MINKTETQMRNTIASNLNDSLTVIGKYHDGKTVRETTVGQLKEQFSDESIEWFEWFFETLEKQKSVNTRFANYSLNQLTKMSGVNTHQNDPLSIEGSPNPMKHEGKCLWNIDEDTEITIYFDYQRVYGTLYVTEIEYVSKSVVSDDVLKEAVMNELGPCQFDNTEILRS